MEKVTLYIPPELITAYSMLAREQGRARPEVMRDALREYAERQEFQLPEWVGMIASDKEVNSSNVKEWLRDYWKPE